jgi:hypothetical protein
VDAARVDEVVLVCWNLAPLSLGMKGVTGWGVPKNACLNARTAKRWAGVSGTSAKVASAWISDESRDEQYHENYLTPLHRLARRVGQSTRRASCRLLEQGQRSPSRGLFHCSRRGSVKTKIQVLD